MVKHTHNIGDIPDFSLKKNGPISRRIVGLNIHRFHDAIDYVGRLKYGRNSSKTNLLTVIDENKGTCSTKHALIKTILNEHEVNSIHLMLGIYRMNENNTPGVGRVLKNYGLDYIPEAHNYLKYRNKCYDYTFPKTANPDVFKQLLDEIVIEPKQIAKFKVEYHQEFLSNWLKKEKLDEKFDLTTIWKIREECIQNLSN